MKLILLIGLGGAFGAVFRFLVSRTAQTLFGFTFPYGTLVVNLIGSFLIGFLSVMLIERIGAFGQESRALLIIGLLGSFTSFSSFSFETIELWESREFFKVTLYVLFSMTLCFSATWCGLLLGRKL